MPPQTRGETHHDPSGLMFLLCSLPLAEPQESEELLAVPWSSFDHNPAAAPLEHAAAREAMKA